MLRPSRQPAKDPAIGYAGTRSAYPPLYAATTRSRGVTLACSITSSSWLQHRGERRQGEVDLGGGEARLEQEQRHVGAGGVPPRQPHARLLGRPEHDEL